MRRYINDDDVYNLYEELQLDVPDNTPLVRMMQKALKGSVVVSYKNVDRLLEVAQSCRRSDACVAAVGGYKRKWCSDRWSWTAESRLRLISLLEDGRKALDSLQAERTQGFKAVALFDYDQDLNCFPDVPASSSAAIPVTPPELKMRALAGGNEVEMAVEYPVLRVGVITFWALNYVDNRYSLAIAACNEQGIVLHFVERRGARYVYKIEQDVALKGIVLNGQADSLVGVKWAELVEIANRFS